jgi:hypothetical protein
MSVGAGSQVIKLSWESNGDDHFASTAVGEYHIGKTGNVHTCTLLCVWNGMVLTQSVSEGDMDEVFAAAQSDLEARVMTLFEAA